MPDLSLAIEILTGEMYAEKKAYRELSRAEDMYYTGMGSENILPKIDSLRLAVEILKGHHQDGNTEGRE